MSGWELSGSETTGEKSELGVRPCSTGREQAEGCGN